MACTYIYIHVQIEPASRTARCMKARVHSGMYIYGENKKEREKEIKSKLHLTTGLSPILEGQLYFHAGCQQVWSYPNKFIIFCQGSDILIYLINIYIY